MKQGKSTNLRVIIIVGILAVVLVGLGILIWLNAVSASTLSENCVTLRPTKDITSGWYTKPVMSPGSHYKNIDEATTDDNDYIWSLYYGSNQEAFGFAPNAGATKITVYARVINYRNLSPTPSPESPTPTPIPSSPTAFPTPTPSPTPGKLSIRAAIDSWSSGSIITLKQTGWTNIFIGTYIGHWTADQLKNLQVQLETTAGSVAVSQVYVTACP